MNLLNPDIDGLSIVPLFKSATAPSPHQALHFSLFPDIAARLQRAHETWFQNKTK